MDGIKKKIQEAHYLNDELITKSGTGPCMGQYTKSGEEKCSKEGTWHRQNTAYANDESNWASYCNDCQEEADAFWQEQWDEYHSMIRV